MPRPGGGAGDQLVAVRIVMPSDVTAGEREAVREAQGSARRQPARVPGLTRRISKERKGGAMRLDKLTVKAQEALQAAQSKADQHNHQAIEPEHLLSALLEQREGVVGPVLAKLGARPDAIQRELRRGARQAAGGERRQRSVSRRPHAEDARTRSERGRAAQGRLRLDRAPPAGARPGSRRGAGQPLAAAGVNAEAIYKALVEIRLWRVTDPNPEEKYQALQRYSRDLTEPRARQARPGHRPGRRDSARDPGALAPHEEQPGPDR